MPQTFYTEDEYKLLERRLARATERAQAAERMRPQWAMGYSSDSTAAQAKAAALQQVWDALGVSNQTECLGVIMHLKAVHQLES